MAAVAVQYEAPRLNALNAHDAVIDDEWAVAAAVATLLGLPVAVVAYICSVCDARSFTACVDAVKNYFGNGC
jgi:hypothetical protein